MPRTRIELVQGQAPRDFKSLASTNSATQAFFAASCRTRPARQEQMLYTGPFTGNRNKCQEPILFFMAYRHHEIVAGWGGILILESVFFMYKKSQ